MPLTILLRESGLSFYVQDSMTIDELAARLGKALASSKPTLILFVGLSGQRLLVRASDIGFVRETTNEEITENKKRAEAAAADGGRLARPNMVIPGGRRMN